MDHLPKCPKAKQYWDLVFRFITTVVGAPPPADRQKAIILNLWSRNKLGDETAIAFIRHAYGKLYDAFTCVDTLNKQFVYQITFLCALISFRNAAIRWAEGIRRHHHLRKYTGKRKHVAEDTREQYKRLVIITSEYTYTLNPAFVAAIATQEQNVKTWRENQAAQAARRRQAAAAPPAPQPFPP